MKVTPYEHSSDSKKQQIEQMFDNISPKYDFLNRSLSLGIDVWWRKKMMRELKGLALNQVLDIATGTADVALATSKLKPNSIIGVDISEGMLSVGRIKVEKKGLSSLIKLQKRETRGG
jgi:demethylmenaquinone methyltransferase/2-methoxy-6-polyprenyl-1,4-benzoquinol methylase